jgi:SAM-dependent methyltransferase
LFQAEESPLYASSVKRPAAYPLPRAANTIARGGSMTQVVHRADTGRSYAGIPMHAAPGVHEHALRLVRAKLFPAARVLDVGTGSGALSARLHDAGFDVLACDLDAGDYVAPPPIVEWDATRDALHADLAPASFDAICAIEVIEHMENPAQALRNFRTLLKPGGALIVSTPNVGHPRSRLKFLLTGAPSYFGRTEYFSSGHRTVIPDWLLKLHIAEAGFEDVRLSYGGSLGLKGAQKLAYSAMAPAFSLLGMLPRPRVSDGCVTFAVAYRPN